MNLSERMTTKLQRDVQEAHRNGYLTAWQVCRQLPITPRQLQWWDEQGYICPQKRLLHKRLYSPDQVEQLRKMAALRKAGVSLQSIRRGKYLTWKFTSVVRVTKPNLIGQVLVVPA